MAVEQRVLIYFDELVMALAKTYAETMDTHIYSPRDILSSIQGLHHVDAVEVVHSFWDDSGRYVFPSGRKAICCDVCKCALSVGEYNRFKWNYCPVCGAKMDGDGNG